MEKATVLLSTYNGSEYVEQFLDSVLNQKDVQIQIIVRDDGSIDGTKTILKRYSDAYENIQVMFGNNEGWRKSFFDLMFSVKPQKGTYYAFADQDDIWIDDKLVSAIDKINSVDFDGPKLYHSNLTLVDQKLNKLGKMYPDDLVPTIQNPQSYFEGIGVGATMVMNAELLKLVQLHRPKLTITHDAYVIELSNLLGKTIYDHGAHILYRRHSNNATGYRENAKIEKPSLIDRYIKYKNAPKNGFSERAEELLNGYQELMSEHDKKVLMKIAKYKSNFKYRLELLFDPRMRASSLRKTLQMKYRTLCNTL